MESEGDINLPPPLSDLDLCIALGFSKKCTGKENDPPVPSRKDPEERGPKVLRNEAATPAASLKEATHKRNKDTPTQGSNRSRKRLNLDNCEQTQTQSQTQSQTTSQMKPLSQSQSQNRLIPVGSAVQTKLKPDRDRVNESKVPTGTLTNERQVNIPSQSLQSQQSQSKQGSQSRGPSQGRSQSQGKSRLRLRKGGRDDTQKKAVHSQSTLADFLKGEKLSQGKENRKNTIGPTCSNNENGEDVDDVKSTKPAMAKSKANLPFQKNTLVPRGRARLCCGCGEQFPGKVFMWANLRPVCSADCQERVFERLEARRKALQQKEQEHRAQYGANAGVLQNIERSTFSRPRNLN